MGRSGDREDACGAECAKPNDAPTITVLTAYIMDITIQYGILLEVKKHR